MQKPQPHKPLLHIGTQPIPRPNVCPSAVKHEGLNEIMGGNPCLSKYYQNKLTNAIAWL